MTSVRSSETEKRVRPSGANASAGTMNECAAVRYITDDTPPSLHSTTARSPSPMAQATSAESPPSREREARAVWWWGPARRALCSGGASSSAALQATRWEPARALPWPTTAAAATKQPPRRKARGGLQAAGCRRRSGLPSSTCHTAAWPASDVASSREPSAEKARPLAAWPRRRVWVGRLAPSSRPASFHRRTAPPSPAVASVAPSGAKAAAFWSLPSSSSVRTAAASSTRRRPAAGTQR
mmetsp:Transcript_19479/g.74755  ORF Transcript_19479/g.74755 Transcript_19479/m.74755 type:complete len:240 (-) Transcript_19479:387-1106(-)